jgi:hypothetical protein
MCARAYDVCQGPSRILSCVCVCVCVRVCVCSCAYDVCRDPPRILIWVQRKINALICTFERHALSALKYFLDMPFGTKQNKYKFIKRKRRAGWGSSTSVLNTVKKRNKKIPCNWPPSVLSPAPPQKSSRECESFSLMCESFFIKVNSCGQTVHLFFVRVFRQAKMRSGIFFFVRAFPGRGNTGLLNPKP